jgi:hypothetical protein
MKTTPPPLPLPKPPPPEISLEGLLMLDLQAWTAAKDAIRRASSTSKDQAR